MQKDYKIHADVVRLIYQTEWDDLWDISPEKLSQEYYADRIMKLSESITEAYVASGAGIPTETLLTKILLGTVGCVPAYDRYFKKAHVKDFGRKFSEQAEINGGGLLHDLSLRGV